MLQEVWERSISPDESVISGIIVAQEKLKARDGRFSAGECHKSTEEVENLGMIRELGSGNLRQGIQYFCY